MVNAVITLPVREHINRVLRSSLDECGLPWIPLYEMSDLPRARSYLITQALQSGADRVVFLDADIVASPSELLALAGHRRVTDHGAVTGLYATRDGRSWACSSPDSTLVEGMRRAEYAGLGFACISRVSLMRVAETLPQLTDPHFGKWFPFCVPFIDESLGDAPVYCADDVSLWRRLSLTGTTLWADPSLVAGHISAVTLRSPVDKTKAQVLPNLDLLRPENDNARQGVA